MFIDNRWTQDRGAEADAPGVLIFLGGLPFQNPVGHRPQHLRPRVESTKRPHGEVSRSPDATRQNVPGKKIGSSRSLLWRESHSAAESTFLTLIVG